MLLWENRFDRSGLSEICEYCDIRADQWWLDTISSSVMVRQKTVSNQEADIYLTLVEKIFDGMPNNKNQLIALMCL